MTREVRKHALAESDLIGIWEYTFQEWGAAQADKYLNELDAVYYTVAPSAIHIIRVLHVQMDPGRHFEKNSAES